MQHRIEDLEAAPGQQANLQERETDLVARKEELDKMEEQLG